MRINKYVAQATGMSRRTADEAIRSGKVYINGTKAGLGSTVDASAEITLDGKLLQAVHNFTSILFNKPAGYVCSRNGQGSKTIYEILPEKYHSLKPVGRLDKDTSGLLILTDDGGLANKLAHPRYQKEKVYRVKLNKTLEHQDKVKLLTGIKLSDGLSKFIQLRECSDHTYEVVLGEGRNRQIRRSFNHLGYKISDLRRVSFGIYTLGNLPAGKFKEVIIRD